MLQGLDEQQSVQLLQCYLQEDYRGTRDSLKVRVLTVLVLGSSPGQTEGLSVRSCVRSMFS